MTRQSCNLFFNPHIYETGPRGPKHYIFGDQFYLKNLFLHFYVRKHDIINHHIHETGPRGPKHYIFGDQFCSNIYCFIFMLENMIYIINHHIHETGPRGPKHYIFGDQFYLKIYSFIFMLENMISKFYLKWTEFFSNLCRVPMDP